MMHNIRDLLRLASVPKIGTQKIRSLVAHFKSVDAVFEASMKELVQIPGIDKKIASHIIHHTGGEKFADEQLKRLNRIDARIVTIWDQEYPELLKKIYDPPAFLFVLGKFSDADLRSMSIVGTRHPTSYGQTVTEQLCTELARRQITIVSGLARGIDTIAHTTALSAGTRTIGVIGSGIDVPYPPENKKLMERIADYGVVVSEFFMGTKPDAPNFPRRNRIVSGLSVGTVVVESAEDGGAMITASTALDQDREVFAIPGSILEKRSTGPNKLIREGRAKLITNVEDIFAELQIQLRLPLEDAVPKRAALNLSSAEQQIFNLLSSAPAHIDALAEQAAASTSDVLVTLLSLEFKGIVRQLPGKLFLKL
ncbi:MAG TPA: DNA-processing protein DprA [Bacteroidota bacterium]|nr:DNA-processing protein DprA [Bacteroidota bacterium]